MVSNIAIVGAGSFGTALARVLSDRGHHIGLYVRETDIYQNIVADGFNANFLPNVKLDMNLVHATFTLAEAVRGRDFVFLTVPAPAVQQTISDFAQYMDRNAILVLTSKGLDKTGETMSQIAAKKLPHKLCGLYGITFAKAIPMAQRLASMCIASGDLETARLVAGLFAENHRQQRTNSPGSSGRFRIYLSTDLRGAELGGAMKNAYAIAMGIIDAYLESTAKAASHESPRPRSSRYSLMNLCMLELVNIGLSQGASLETLIGPSGIGDLVACVSTDPRGVESKNYKWGRWKALDQLEGGHKQSPDNYEGHETILGAVKILEKSKGLKLPVLTATYDILFNARQVVEVIPKLLQDLRGCVDYKLSKDKAVGPAAQAPSKGMVSPRKSHRVAFLSYRFALEEYLKVVESIAAFHNITVDTGVANGPTKGGSITKSVQDKIKRADFYIAVFPNDKSDSKWLTNELHCAIGAEKPLLIFLEEGASPRLLGEIGKGLQYHRFTRNTFASKVAEQLKAVDKRKNRRKKR